MSRYQLGPRPIVLVFHVRMPEEFRISVRRPDDLLVFDLVFENLVLSGNTPERLVRKDPAAPAYFVVEFPPQSFGEQAFLDAAGPTETSDKEVSKAPGYRPKNVPTAAEPVAGLLPARIRMAGRSRVALAMPEGVDHLGYALADVLQALRTWPMQLDTNAVPDADPAAFDRGWLELVTAGWMEAATLLAAGLATQGVTRVDRRLAQAARRVGNLVSADLSRGRARGLDRRIVKAMEAEIDLLAERIPQLRQGRARETAFAALALASTRVLATGRGKFEIDASVVGIVPWLPILFGPHEPPKSVTALELPYRLLLSPLEPARWRHSDAQVVHQRPDRALAHAADHRRRRRRARSAKQGARDLVA